MSEEKKTAATEDVKEARELTEKELEQVTGGANPSLMGPAAVAAYSYMELAPVIQPPV